MALSDILIVNSFHPGLIMIIMGLLMCVFPIKYGKTLYIMAPMLAIIAMLNMSVKSTMLYRISSDLSINLIDMDRLAFIFLAAFCLISFIGATYSLNNDNKYEMGLSLVYAGSNMGAVLAGDILAFVIFWELSAIASCYIVYSNHTRKSSRAAFRYILMHAFGGNMLLVGVISYIHNYGMAITNLTGTDSFTFWMIFIGIAVNTAVPPFNSWMPDAYPESTIWGTVYLGSFTTKTAIYAMIRFFAGTDWLVWVGAFMAVYGICMALLENDLRRLLSYHIMSQLGYMVASLAMGAGYGIDGAAAHAFTNIMYKGTLLMCAGAVIMATGKRTISELGGLYKKMPLTAICFLIASLAISGMPLLNGFVSKALVMHAVKEGGYTVAAYMLTAASVGTWMSVTIKINYFVFFGPEPEKKGELGTVDNRATGTELKPIPFNMKAAMVMGAAVCVITGLFPNIIYNMTPYATNAHPFTADHVIEYLVLFIGGTIIFFMFITRMHVHDEISLDFDWLYRRVLDRIVDGLSKGIYAILAFFDVKVLDGVHYLGAHMGNPELWTKNSSSKTIRNISFMNEDRAIGDVILVIVFAVVAMLIACLCVIK